MDGLLLPHWHMIVVLILILIIIDMMINIAIIDMCIMMILCVAIKLLPGLGGNV